jgi:hypothetical protein
LSRLTTAEREQCANRSLPGAVPGTDYANYQGSNAPAARCEPGESIVIKSSEFGTIAVLVGATAAVVALQQHRERERRIEAPPPIEAPVTAPSTDARALNAAGVDLAITATPRPTSPAGGP